MLFLNNVTNKKKFVVMLQIVKKNVINYEIVTKTLSIHFANVIYNILYVICM